MEYQFENVQRYNRKMYLEFNYKILCWRALLWGVVSLILMLSYVYRALIEPYWWVGVVVFAGLTIHYFTWPYRLERKRFQRAQSYYDGEMPSSYIRFGDQIHVEEIDSTFTLEYRKIEKVIVLKHGLFLRYAEKAHMAIDPNCFTKGTYEEFKQFLREKCPHLKISD
jgi:hypothetical protein